MQDTIDLFNQAFFLINSNDLEANNEDYYALMHAKSDHNNNHRFKFSATNANHRKAVALFEQFIAINPNCKFAYNFLAIAHTRIGNFSDALSNFSKAIHIDPHYANAYHNRSQVLYSSNEFSKALADSSKAIDLVGSNAVFYHERGKINLQLGNRQDAIEDFTNSINLNPTDILVFKERALTYYYLDKYENAIADFNKIYQMDPSNFDHYYYRGFSYFELKQYQKAIDDFNMELSKDEGRQEIVQSKINHAKILLHIDEQILLEKGMPCKKSIILDAFSTMNLSLLEVTLDDYKTYQDATKEIFIEKVKLLFEEFKKNNDTYLMPIKGKCNSQYCHFGCSGYAFVGNVSKSYINLIFEETENNFKYIFDCSDFKTDHKIKDLKVNLSIDINTDEKAHFIKTADYILTTDAALKAFSEIVSDSPQLIDLEQINHWVNKHNLLFEKISKGRFNYDEMKWSDFTVLYEKMQTIVDYFNSNHQFIDNALKSAKKLKTEQNKSDWIAAYEELFENTPFISKYNATLNENSINYTINIKKEYHLILSGSEFLKTKTFIKIYESYMKEIKAAKESK